MAYGLDSKTATRVTWNLMNRFKEMIPCSQSNKIRVKVSCVHELFLNEGVKSISNIKQKSVNQT